MVFLGRKSLETRVCTFCIADRQKVRSPMQKLRSGPSYPHPPVDKKSRGGSGLAIGKVAIFFLTFIFGGSISGGNKLTQARRFRNI